MIDVQTVLWRVFGGVVAAFMVSPLLILILFCFSESSLVTFPIRGLTFDWFVQLFQRPAFWVALQNSLIVTGTVGLTSTVFGTMAAFALARMRPSIAGVFLLFLTLPVMLPPLVLGVALLTYFSTVGLRFGLPTVILSHLVFTQPFVILIVQARMIGFDYNIVSSARDLGASPFKAFFTVTLPIIRPTIIGAGMVAMALSVDDFIITFFTIGGGNTLPTFLWGMLRMGVNPSINIVATLIMMLTIAVSLVALRVTRYRG
jgi:spermidine/putrescine transport system permease protein